jgi:hypothetical protein
MPWKSFDIMQSPMSRVKIWIIGIAAIVAIFGCLFLTVKQLHYRSIHPDVKVYSNRSLIEKFGLTKERSHSLRYHYINLDDWFFVFSLEGSAELKSSDGHLKTIRTEGTRTFYAYSKRPSPDDEFQRQLAVAMTKLENLDQ